MAGTNELHTQMQEEEEEEEHDIKTTSTFEWDENSQLYYHSSTGFYFNLKEDWYYSSRDGLYYKFQDGNYVLLSSESNQAEQYETSNNCERMASDNFDEDIQCMPIHSLKDSEDLAERVGKVPDEHTTDDLECTHNHLEDPSPPSEWLEDTLIDLYLSGYPNQVASVAPDIMTPSVTNDKDPLDTTAGAGENDAYELEEGEWIPDERFGSTDSSRNITDEGVSWEEENWQAQYGQVTQSYVESALDIRIVDLWDWEMIRGTRTRKDGKHMVARLIGRLVKSSSNLHPSVPSGSVRLKTAPICEAHLDLVQVTTGQIYRLKKPSSQYLASILSYDSSNPTRDWGFPQLSLNRQTQELPRIVGHGNFQEASRSPEHPYALEKEKQHYAYRDRAAERRTLHGGFGVGPGQKKAPNEADSALSSSTSICPEEAAAESLNISFGAGSYARRLLENMGWKEGEALGISTKGLVEPLQAIGNKGSAGLGWDDSRKKNSL